MGRKRKIHPPISSTSQSPSQTNAPSPDDNQNIEEIQSHNSNISDEERVGFLSTYTPFTQALLYTGSETDDEGLVYRLSEIEEQLEADTTDVTIVDEIKLHAARQSALHSTLQAVENYLSHLRNLEQREAAGEFAGQGYMQPREKDDKKDGKKDGGATHA